ncbi:MAG TPA: Rieske (2Fe-2S) protein [Gemmatimonadaceae bacterium]|nr:Rieske (2Fe-2S) protein [Gemmatimonadaceae bacterium]
MSARHVSLPTPQSARPLDRREFVCLSACALAGVAVSALAGCASLVTRQVTPVDGKIELALAHYPELTEPGGSLKILPEGEVAPLYVLALDDGSYAALSPICTHLGCTVEIQGARLICPCHGSTYDRTGTVLQGPAQLPLTRLRTVLTADGVLVINLGDRA